MRNRVPTACLRRGRPPAWAALGLLLAAACTSTPAHAPTPAPAPGSAATSVASPSCPASADLGAGGLPDRQGVGTGASLWGLFFLDGRGIVEGTEVKIAWRMTGAGGFSIDATGPGGRTVRPVWGPEPHTGSTWTRPGEEWGTGWVFPVPGCWTFAATRDQGRGRLAVRVAAASGPTSP
jgi:hypothetical protein